MPEKKNKNCGLSRAKLAITLTMKDKIWIKLMKIKRLQRPKSKMLPQFMSNNQEIIIV